MNNPEASDDLDDLNFFNQKKKKKKNKKYADAELEEGMKVSSVFAHVQSNSFMAIIAFY